MKFKNHKFSLLFIFIFFGLFFFTEASSAADRYVRAGASGSGNGSDWTNAWTNFNSVSWSGMGTGDTLWIGAGTYTGSLPTLNVSGITIKRAIASTHGTNTGWSSAYDGQVTINLSDRWLNIAADNITLDGAGYNPWSFKINGSPGWNGQIEIDDGSDNILIRNIEMDGSARGGGEDAFRVYGGSGLTIEHNYIHDYSDYSGIHNDGIQMPKGNNLTVRYNIWKNLGQHIFLGDVSWLGSSAWVNNIRIYYNLFYNTNGLGWGSYDTVVFKNAPNTGNYAYIENNTFATRNSNLGQPGYRLVLRQNNGSTAQMYFRNNIVYDAELGDATSGTNNNNLYYNLYNSSAPMETGRITSNPLFTDYANNDYRLQSTSPAINAGTNIGLTTDILGNSISGNPDIGAYEVGSTPPPTPTPTATPTPTPTPVFSKCDQNHDSSINVLDLQSLANVILGKTVCSYTCDLNQDSSTNVLDLQYLANVILGKSSCP